jgi:four helix bundle protein
MGTVTKFEDLNVWQNARDLCRIVHIIIERNIGTGDLGLFKQVSRSSGSVMDNIAEGFGRSSRKEFIQFLFIANGSLMETKSQLYRALDYGYLIDMESQDLFRRIELISRMIFKLGKYLQTSIVSGQKHK